MPLFTNALSELRYFLANISLPFGGYTGPRGQPLGERGIDVGLPYGTPIYATASGRVLGTTPQYGGGGVVSEQVSPTLSEYYQHLSSEVVHAGDLISANQLIGYSGGQLSGGSNPAGPGYSTGPHIEIGFNGPWGSPWDALGMNFNPVPDLQAQENALATGSGTIQYPSGSKSTLTTGPSGGNGCGSMPPLGSAQYPAWAACVAVQAGATATATVTDPIGTGLSDIGTWFQTTFGITSGADLTWRVLFIGLALFLFLLGLAVIVFDLLDKSNIEVAGSRV